MRADVFDAEGAARGADLRMRGLRPCIRLLGGSDHRRIVQNARIMRADVFDAEGAARGADLRMRGLRPCIRLLGG